MTVTGSGDAAPAHKQGVRFHHAERFSFAEVGGFAAGRVFVRGHNYFMVMLPAHIRDTQLFRVKELPHIPAYFPRVILTGYATMIVLAVFRCSYLLLRLFTGFATHINLHGGQVGLLERDGIAAAGRADV